MFSFFSTISIFYSTNLDIVCFFALKFSRTIICLLICCHLVVTSWKRFFFCAHFFLKLLLMFDFLLQFVIFLILASYFVLFFFVSPKKIRQTKLFRPNYHWLNDLILGRSKGNTILILRFALIKLFLYLAAS